MQKEDFDNLLNRYNAGEATPEERALIESWYLKYEPNKSDLPHDQLQGDQQESIKQLLHQIKDRPHNLYWLRCTSAAAILIFLSVGVYFINFNKTNPPLQARTKLIKHDAAPGGNKATLTLADGATIVLTGSLTGKLASQGNMIVNKTAEGKINYDHAGRNVSIKKLVYNIAATPRGGQFQFVLSDGTSVWLNSASSIKYPVEFFGNERKVELTGEAYFEVAHNAKKPFRVVSNGQTVEVLGTHFNINSYSDEEATKTTLLQGSIKVISAVETNVIKPGEQAQLRGGKLTVTLADVDEAIAWKNGLFNFKDNTIQDVMRQLSRWYDVDVRYEGKIPERLFSGEISKNVNASQIKEILNFKKIHFKIEGKKIIVIP